MTDDIAQEGCDCVLLANFDMDPTHRYVLAGCKLSLASSNGVFKIKFRSLPHFGSCAIVAIPKRGLCNECWSVIGGPSHWPVAKHLWNFPPQTHSLHDLSCQYTTPQNKLIILFESRLLSEVSTCQFHNVAGSAANTITAQWPE